MRKARDWSAVQAHEALHEGLGWRPKSKASYAALEDGRPLRPSEEAFLRGFFGGGPTDEDREPPGESNSEGVRRDGDALAALYEKLDAQADAINALARQVEALIARPQAELATALVELIRSGLLSTAPTESRVAEPPPQ